MSTLASMRERLVEFREVADLFETSELAEARGKVLESIVALVASEALTLSATAKALRKMEKDGLINNTEYRKTSLAVLKASTSSITLPSRGGGGSDSGGGNHIAPYRSETGPANGVLHPRSNGSPSSSADRLNAAAAAAAGSSQSFAGSSSGTKGAKKSRYVAAKYKFQDACAGLYQAAKDIDYSSIPLAVRKRYPLRTTYKVVPQRSNPDKGKVTWDAVLRASGDNARIPLGAFKDRKTAVFAVACATADRDRFGQYCKSLQYPTRPSCCSLLRLYTYIHTYILLLFSFVFLFSVVIHNLIIYTFRQLPSPQTEFSTYFQTTHRSVILHISFFVKVSA